MSAQPPEWDDLAVFLAVAREGGLSAAARILGVNHATVHRRVGRLEQALGTRLFDRSRQGFTLTGAGAELQGHVEGMEAHVHAIGRTIRGRDQRLEGLVRLTTVDDMAAVLLPEIIQSFRKAHPLVTVEVMVSSRFVRLGEGAADIALRFATPPAEPDVLRRRVGAVGTALYASRDYLRAHPVPRTLDELSEHDVVRAGPELSRLGMEQLMDRYGDPTRVALRTNLMLARAAAVRAGLGVGMLACFVGDHEPDLVRLPVELPDVSASLWMGVHQDIRKAARVRALADHTFHALQAMAPRLAGTTG